MDGSFDATPHLRPLLRRPEGWLHAPHLAVVTSLDDPKSLHRAQVRLIACDDADNQDAAMWARVVCPFAGKNRGAFLLPDVGDEVLVMFHNGDPSCPLIVGGLWNGDSAPPAQIENGGVNRYKRLQSSNGVVLTLDDQQGQEAFVVETPGGQRITLKDGPGKVLIEDAAGNSVTMETAGITIVSSATVKVQASRVEVQAGMVQVDTAMAKFSGAIECQALIATVVTSKTYSPGAGNVW